MAHSIDTGLRRVSFTVAGLPAPQGSKVAMPHRYTGKPFMKEQAGEKLKDWRAAVEDAAWIAMLGFAGTGRDRAARLESLQGPVGVSLAFTLPRPASAPKGRSWPCVRPDLDKLVRAVLDALTGPVLADDGQVVDLRAQKNYPSSSLVDTGVFIDVWQIGEGS
jgi:crossover junction endodeoxyribonuclease RusA